MSELPGNSPIQRLDFDLLWYIVKMNANMFDDRKALETTLATSRVCHDWRTFMLGMPSIWAHLIDLDRLHGRIGKQRSEIIRRSGTALLWIKYCRCVGHDPDDYSSCAKYAISMIGKHWSRIQRLEADLYLRHVDLAHWEPLYSSAPHLELLDLKNSVFPPVNNVHPRPLLSLLGQNAPILRTFRYSGHTPLLTSPWLHQLHSMVLGIKLTVSEALGILTSTENLINLDLERIVADLTTSPLPFVSLPKVTHLRLSFATNLNACIVLLDHMHIPPVFSLRLAVYLPQAGEIVNQSTMRSMIRVISTFIRSHFAPPRKLSLSYSDSRFWLMDRTGGPASIFVVNSGDQVFPSHALPIFLSEFTLPNFSKVTEFKFSLEDVNGPVPEFTAFTACLPSVELIRTDKLSLHHLTRAQEALKTADTGPIAFPALKVLKLGSFTPIRFDSSVSDPISEFVMARIAHGYAIDIVDFTSDALNLLPDLEFLKDADGLTVRWRQKGVAYILEYICGTGTSEDLLFV